MVYLFSSRLVIRAGRGGIRDSHALAFKLIHPGSHAPAAFHSLTTPTYRASTVVFERQADVSDDWRQTEKGYTYGLYGTPTVLELGARIAEIEGAHHTFVVPGGQAAISLIYLAFCKSGSHALVPYTAYGPNRELAALLLKRLGITVEAYDPLIGAGIANLIREDTALIWVESPGSVTMEIQDVPAIVAAARDARSSGTRQYLFRRGSVRCVAHGVDVSMQALTKYVGATATCCWEAFRWRAASPMKRSDRLSSSWAWRSRRTIAVWRSAE